MGVPSLFLEDYLDRPDFAEALSVLAGNVNSTAKLPARVQEIGLVCQSVLLASQHLENKYPGMKIFFLGEGSPVVFIENGKEIPFTTRVGFGYYKGVILELAEPGIGSTIFSQTDISSGKIMINHLGFFARGENLIRKDGANSIAYADVMRKAGFSERIDAVLDIKGMIGHIHIFETMKETFGVEIEFLDFRLFSPKGIAINYPYNIVGLLGWYQKAIGPRFLNLNPKQTMPPEPM